MTFECAACGVTTPEEEQGCWVDLLCVTCCPTAGRCADCRDERRELAADHWQRHLREGGAA